MFKVFSSLKKRISSVFAPKSLAEIPPELRAALDQQMNNEKILHCLRVEKVFYKNPSSFSGETFFRNVAVLTDKRLILAKESSSYQKIKTFFLVSVSGCESHSDSGKPALLVEFSDRSQVRLVFAFDDPETGVFENTLKRVRSDQKETRTGGAFCGQCGKQSRAGARFCHECGTRLDFITSENTMTDK